MRKIPIINFVINNLSQRLQSSYVFTILVLLGTVLYVFFGLTPSSYGLALSMLGSASDGLIMGTPQPLRSDEWAVWTPYIQIAVNNEFQRYNLTSPYAEDLRNFNALPLLDWGLFFKPQFWGFFILPPSWAFAMHHGLIIAAFLLGWMRVFRALGFESLTAILLSFTAFFFPYTQLWWTTTGPLLAFFPWLLIVFLSSMRNWLRFLLTLWLSATFLLSHLYPPIIISLMFAGVVLLIALQPSAFFDWKRVSAAGCGAAIGASLAFFYLNEAISVMSNTVYPGDRSLMGGGLHILQYFAHFFPSIVSSGRESLIGANYLEVATGGTYLLALMWPFFFSNRFITTSYKSIEPAARRSVSLLVDDRFAIACLLTGLVLLSAWLLLPVPVSFGKVLLWHLVPHQRFVFAFGIMLLAMLVIIAERWARPPRLAGFGLVLLGVAFIFGGSRFLLGGSWIDGIPIMVGSVVFILLVARFRWRTTHAALTGSISSMLITYGSFNPIQLAHPIFSPPVTVVTERLDEQAAHAVERTLIAPGFPGAILNGVGYRSIQHVAITPQLEFFRSMFPELSEEEFNQLFNRYAHVRLSERPAPFNPHADVIEVPLERFSSEYEINRTVNPFLINGEPHATCVPSSFGGHIDHISFDVETRTLSLVGWAPVDRILGSPRLSLFGVGEVDAEVTAIARPDVVSARGDPRLMESGFSLLIKIETEQLDSNLCLVAIDETFGENLIPFIERADFHCALPLCQ